MAAHGIYQACFQEWFPLDVLNIQLPGTRLTKIAGVPLPSALFSMNLVRFTPSCFAIRMMQC